MKGAIFQFSLVIILLTLSCSKSDSDPLPAEDCRAEKFTEGNNSGMDKVFTFIYGNQDRLLKITNFSQSTNSTDSMLFTYDNSGLLAGINNKKASPLDAVYEYSGGKLIKMKVFNPNNPGDSVVYTYQYNGGDKPNRRNYYSYSSAGTGGLVGYVDYEYDSKGNISVLRNFGGDPGQFATANFSYLGTRNSFASMAPVSDAFNVINLNTNIFKDVVWNRYNLDKGVFRNSNGDIVREVRMNYQLDNNGNITGMIAKKSHPGSADTVAYEYHVVNKCK